MLIRTYPPRPALAPSLESGTNTRLAPYPTYLVPAERPGDQLGQRRVGFALARRRAHTHLQHTASIRQLFDAVDRVTPAARRKPHREHESVRLDPPGRSSRAHSAER